MTKTAYTHYTIYRSLHPYPSWYCDIMLHDTIIESLMVSDDVSHTEEELEPIVEDYLEEKNYEKA